MTVPGAPACRDKLQAEFKALELAKQDLEIGHVVLADSLRQTRAENERLLQEVERFRNRIINANKDYVGGRIRSPNGSSEGCNSSGCSAFALLQSQGNQQHTATAHLQQRPHQQQQQHTPSFWPSPHNSKRASRSAVCLAVCCPPDSSCVCGVHQQADILEHREEQVRVAEGRSGALQLELERLQATIAALTEELGQLKVRRGRRNYLHSSMYTRAS